LAYYDELGQVWQFLERYFKAQLPLRDVAWRTPMPSGTSGSTLVTISTLPVQVLAHDHALFRNLSGGGSGRTSDYRAPYAHLNLVVCETAEAYKSAVKARVKAWVDERIERQEEWLLVYVPLGTQNNTHEMYLKIYAKMAADFGSKVTGDRSSMLTLFEQGVSGSIGGGGGAGPGTGSGVMLQQNHQEQWGDVMTKIKTVVGNTFIARSKAYQEQVRALEEGAVTAAATATATSAAAAGEDFFFRLFFAKESLALMNEQLQLPGEALHHYQELSVLTNRWQAALMPSSSETESSSSSSSSSVVPPKALMMFQPSRAPSSYGIGGGVPVLDFPVFEFRVKLEARGGVEGGDKGESRVGMLEVQQYLFAREAGFLLHLGRYSELFRRTHAFIILQHQTLLRLLPPPSSPPPSTAAEEASDVGARDSAHLWALVAGWTVLQMWEDFLEQQQQQQQQQVQPSALPNLASSTSSPSPSPLPPMAVPQPDATATAGPSPPSLRATSASSLGPPGSSSGSNAASKVIILEPGLMARNLAELLDFIRVRFWDLGRSLLGPQKLQEESIVCAARRDTLIGHNAGPSSTPSPRRPGPSPPPSSSSSSPQVLTSLSDIDAFLRSSSSSSSSSSLSSSSSASNGDGGASAGLEDPRHVALSTAALFARAAPWMRETLDTVSAFDEQYLRVTEVLVCYLEKGGRERFVGRVQAERASILLRRGEWEEARKVLRRLAEHNLRRDFWMPLLSQVLRQLARCEKERGNAKAYVGTLLQILSLQCLDEATGAYYRSELDEYVRQRMPSSSSSSSSSSPRLIRPLSLLVTARVKTTPRDLAPIPPSVELGKPASVIVWLHSALKQPLPVDGLTLILGDVRQLRKQRRLGADYGWMTVIPPASTSSAAAATGSDIDGGLLLSPRATTPRRPSPRRNTDLAASINNLGSTISGSSTNMNVSSPRLSSVLVSDMTTTGTAAAAAEEEQQPEDFLTWKLCGPLTLEPGVNELELVTTSLPPPGTYVYEKLVLQWGSLVLEQDQLAALDPDTLDAATKQRPPPRRFSALAKVPVRRAVGLTVVAKPPATSLAVLTSPVSPPDSQHVHHLSVLLDTHSDTLTAPILTLNQPVLKALAVKGPALLAFYPQKTGNDDEEGEAPLREEEVEVAWDGATATMALPPFLPPHTSLIFTVALHPLPEVVDAFIRGRQDHQRLVSVQVQLTAEFNKDNFLPRRADAEQDAAAAAAAAAAATASDAVSPRSSSISSFSTAPSIIAPTNQNQRRRSLSPTTGTWGHDVLEEALRRNTLRAGCEIVIQQPFSVTISVQGCSHWRSSRRYFVQALLRNRAPLPVTLHTCHLRLPPSYRIVVPEDDDDNCSSSSKQGAHLRDLLLAPGQDVRYAYLIERIVSAVAAAAAAGTEAAASSAFREAPSKMSVSADYTWESLRPINQARVRRHHPPQQQQSFERYFQDSAMLNRGDPLRTFVVRAQLVPATLPSSSSLLYSRDQNVQEDVAAAAAFQDQQHHHLLLPACAPATPGDVEERGVVVGHFQNRVTEGVVGVALRLELAAELSEEAAREAMAATARAAATAAATAAAGEQEGEGRGRFRLIYEVAADPADWAVWGVTKGTVEVGPPAADDGSSKHQLSSARVVLECKLVPVRAGLLACPALTFEPVDVRAAVSPRSRRKSNVRWVGPRDILVVSAPGLKRIPTVRLV
jgi:hypothetical protein